MRTMKHLVSSAAAKFAALTLGCAALCASTVLAAGFDGKSLTTNDWFDVGFSGVTADTPITAGSTTGITLGAGSWTAPTSGEAVVLSASSALSIDTDPDDALTLTPVASPATGMETVAVKVKANVSTSLEDITPTDSPIAAFAIYNNGTAVKPAAYVSGGWTNLVCANVTDLTNGWFTLYIDYANVDNAKSVRFSVQPDGGSVAVLADSNGTTWFTSASSATKISSLSFCGSGLCQTISGDCYSNAVAQVNGVNYATFAEAIAALQEGQTITVLNYDSQTMIAPDGWKFVTENDVTTLVYDPVVTTLADLLVALKAGGLVKLGADITTDEDFPEILTGANAVLDLNGHTLSPGEQDVIYLGGDLTIMDSVGTGKILADAEQFIIEACWDSDSDDWTDDPSVVVNSGTIMVVASLMLFMMRIILLTRKQTRSTRLLAAIT